MRHPVKWLAPAPVWPELAKVEVPAFARPDILRFATDTFMDDFLKQLETEPAGVGAFRAKPETWRGPASSLKLYQAAHQRHYLVTASLICQIAGLPDRAVDGGQQESVSFVLRRLLANGTGEREEYALVTSGQGYTWTKVTTGNRTSAEVLVPGEELLSMFAVNYKENNRNRRVFAGTIPVGKQEIYENSVLDESSNIGRNGAATTAKTARKILFQTEVIAPWNSLVENAEIVKKALADSESSKLFGKNLDSDQITDRNTENQNTKKAVREQIQTGSWYVLLDFANYITKYLPDLGTAIETAGNSGLTRQSEKDFYDLLKNTVLPVGLVNDLTNDPKTGIKNIKTNLHDAPRKWSDIDEIEVYFAADELQAAQSNPLMMPPAYFVFADIARQFCAHARFISSQGTLDLEGFIATLENTIDTYECVRQVFLTKVVDRADLPLTAEDVAGLHVVDQILAIANSLLTEASSGCMDNHALWENFTRLAAQEKNFVDVWLETVLAQNGRTRYPDELAIAINTIRPLVINSQISGNPGIIGFLQAKDLCNANLKQREVDDILNRDICRALTARLYGSVRNDRKQSLAGADIRVFDRAGALIAQTKTDSSAGNIGNYEISNLSVGVYDVNASLTGHRSETKTVRISNLDSIRQDFILVEQASAVITGTVSFRLFFGDTPLPDAQVELVGKNVDLKTKTDSKGIYIITVPPDKVDGQVVILTVTPPKGTRLRDPEPQSEKFQLTSEAKTFDFFFQ